MDKGVDRCPTDSNMLAKAALQTKLISFEHADMVSAIGKGFSEKPVEPKSVESQAL
jgi:hypothetical protein